MTSELTITFDQFKDAFKAQGVSENTNIALTDLLELNSFNIQGITSVIVSGGGDI